MVEYVEKLDSSMVKKAVLITSCASKKHRQDPVRDALVSNGIQVAPGEFICRGSFLFLGAGHPNRKDINDAISFVRKVTELFSTSLCWRRCPMRSVAGKIDWLQAMLFCGILSPLLYLATDRLAGRLLNGYSFASQSMSELSAAGSPTRSLVLSLNLVAALLMIAFGVGGWIRVLSIAIPASYVLLAILRFATADSSSAGQAAPLIGA